MSRRTIVFYTAVALMAVLVTACGGGAGGSTGGGGAAQNVSVTANEFKFEPAAINATPGQTINLTVRNSGATQHTWVLKESNVKITVDPGKSVTQTFTAPRNAGTYPIECDVPGHKEAGMVGQVVVK